MDQTNNLTVPFFGLGCQVSLREGIRSSSDGLDFKCLVLSAETDSFPVTGYDRSREKEAASDKWPVVWIVLLLH